MVGVTRLSAALRRAASRFPFRRAAPSCDPALYSTTVLYIIYTAQVAIRTADARARVTRPTATAHPAHGHSHHGTVPGAAVLSLLSDSLARVSRLSSQTSEVKLTLYTEPFTFQRHDSVTQSGQTRQCQLSHFFFNN